MSTLIGVAVAHTAMRTGEITEIFIVTLRTLAPSITHVCLVQTDGRSTTSVETRAVGVFTLMLVLVAWAVIESVAPRVRRQTVTVS